MTTPEWDAARTALAALTADDLVGIWHEIATDVYGRALPLAVDGTRLRCPHCNELVDTRDEYTLSSLEWGYVHAWSSGLNLSTREVQVNLDNTPDLEMLALEHETCGKVCRLPDGWTMDYQ